jgi:methylmalonyl-CoA mutase cobalamin-binding subunit
VARLYADENFPFPVVEELRQCGHDVMTLQEAGYGGQAIPDEAVLEQAFREHRAVLTINRKHFIALHKTSPRHAGIVVCSFDPQFQEQAHRIHQALDAYGGDVSGQLLRINRPQKT